MRAIAFFALVAAIILAIIGLVYAIIGFTDGNTTAAIVGVALIVVPIAGFLFLRRAAVAEGRPAFEEALKSFGGDQNQWFYGTGIALDSSGRRVLLAGPKDIRIVSVDDVSGHRSYFSNVVPVGNSSNPLGAILMVISVIGLMFKYFRNGMYVDLRNGGPEHQLFGISQKQALLWQQRLDEARKPAIAA